MSHPSDHKPVIVGRRVDELIQYDRNSRIHNEAQVAQLAASIKEFGFTNPVLIDEQNTIIAGDGRVRAAKKLKLETVPCIVLTGFTEAQRAAYVIADNKLALDAGWDAEMLLAELDRIAHLDLSINLTGFNAVEIQGLIDALDTAQAGVVTETNTPSSGDTHPPQNDWGGMPEFHQPSNKPFRTILMHFNDQESVDAFEKLVMRRITDKTKYLWYPEQVKLTKEGVVYA